MGLVTVNPRGDLLTTSLAIAEGTDNDHASVILLIRKYVEDLREFGLVDFKSESTGGRPTEYALLNEPQATLLMTYMRNSEIVRDFKKKLVRAFYDFAVQQAMSRFNIPTTLSGALLLAANQAEQIEEQKERLAIVEPKAEALDRLANADGLTSMTVAAKLVGMPPRKFISHLHAHQWIYHSGSGWVGREDRVRQGLIQHRYHPYIGSDGQERQKPQVYLTPKAITKLSVLLGSAAQ